MGPWLQQMLRSLGDVDGGEPTHVWEQEVDRKSLHLSFLL